LKELLEMAAKRIKINAIDTNRFKLPGGEEGGWEEAVDNAKVQLEYQENRQIDLELMNQFGSNSWKIHNQHIEKMIQKMQEELEETNQKITEVNKQRKQDQVLPFLISYSPKLHSDQ
jgi:pre-mRNA-splicing factor SPF27